MSKTIQEAAKEKVIALFTDYEIAYIDYDARDNEYTIKLEAKVTQDDKSKDLCLDGSRVQD
ncbi:hypothetical protein ACQKGD_10755 [Peribacillus frigoritolerans]|uniref:hypothetical protein n=1 Tax=Peribacillus frigoritolerans TaxID=450367 RepID=UPI003D07479E